MSSEPGTVNSGAELQKLGRNRKPVEFHCTGPTFFQTNFVQIGGAAYTRYSLNLYPSFPLSSRGKLCLLVSLIKYATSRDHY